MSKILPLVLFFVFAPHLVMAAVNISEIMYDLKEGSDTGREWIEIYNDTDASVKLTEWKLFEAETNHKISTTTTAQDGFVSAHGYAIIVDDTAKFSADWPNLVATIFKSSFSLSNSGETLTLKDSVSATVDSVSYSSSQGASGDGNSLQKVDTAWKGATPTPGVVAVGVSLPNSSSSSQTSSTNDTATTTTTTQTTTANTSESGGGGWAVEPQIFARIKGKTSAISGADTLFEGESRNVRKEPISKARYIWNFGDGEIKEGQNVLHAYYRPGRYVVVLTVAVEPFSAIDRFVIDVIPADLIISEVVHGVDGGLRISNRGSKELNLSWWRIQSGNNFFTLPKDTFIVANGDLFLSYRVSKLDLTNGPVNLLYPNGELAYNFNTGASHTMALNMSTYVPIEGDYPPEENVPLVSNLPLKQEVNKIVIGNKAVAAVGAALDNTQSKDMDSSGANKSNYKWWALLGGVMALGLAPTFVGKRFSKSKTSESDDIRIIE